MPSSGLRQWMQHALSWPLLLALALSLCLHLWVFSEIGLRGDMFNPPAPPALQARILPPPAPLPVPAPVPESPAPRPHPRLVPSVPPQPTALPSTPVTAAEAVPEAAEGDALPPASVATPDDRLAEIAAWHETDHPQAVEEEPQAKPYQHVSTDFEVFVNGESRPAGKASIEYVREEADHYRLHWQVEGRGLLKLLYPALDQQSSGQVTLSGLRPSVYRYAFGQRVDKTYEARFDWDNSVITLKTSKGEQQQPLQLNTQDILSFMYQFMFVPPLQQMRVILTNGRKLGEYEYVFEGEDSLVIDDRTVQTLHIAHTRGDTDEKTELWLASEYRYVPVKIRKLEKNGMVIEQVATRLIAE